MSSLLYLMRQGEKGKRCIGARTGRRPARQRFCRMLTVHRSLTLPLLCSGCRFEIERAEQVGGGFAQGHALDTGPEVDGVALPAAGGVEAMAGLPSCPRHWPAMPGLRSRLTAAVE